MKPIPLTRNVKRTNDVKVERVFKHPIPKVGQSSFTVTRKRIDRAFQSKTKLQGHLIRVK